MKTGGRSPTGGYADRSSRATGDSVALRRQEVRLSACSARAMLLQPTSGEFQYTLASGSDVSAPTSAPSSLAISGTMSCGAGQITRSVRVTVGRTK